jgi:hypothetical protein
MIIFSNSIVAWYEDFLGYQEKRAFNHEFREFPLTGLYAFTAISRENTIGGEKTCRRENRMHADCRRKTKNLISVQQTRRRT